MMLNRKHFSKLRKRDVKRGGKKVFTFGPIDFYSLVNIRSFSSIDFKRIFDDFSPLWMSKASKWIKRWISQAWNVACGPDGNWARYASVDFVEASFDLFGDNSNIAGEEQVEWKFRDAAWILKILFEKLYKIIKYSKLHLFMELFSANNHPRMSSSRFQSHSHKTSDGVQTHPLKSLMRNKSDAGG